MDGSSEGSTVPMETRSGSQRDRPTPVQNIMEVDDTMITRFELNSTPVVQIDGNQVFEMGDSQIAELPNTTISITGNDMRSEQGSKSSRPYRSYRESTDYGSNIRVQEESRTPASPIPKTPLEYYVGRSTFRRQRE